MKKEAISPDGSTDPDGRAPKQQASSGTGPGAKLQASSYKPQASSTKLVQVPDAGVKPRAKSIKLQAASDKLPNLQALIKFQAASIRGLD